MNFYMDQYTEKFSQNKEKQKTDKHSGFPPPSVDKQT